MKLIILIIICQFIAKEPLLRDFMCSYTTYIIKFQSFFERPIYLDGVRFNNLVLEEFEISRVLTNCI